MVIRMEVDGVDDGGINPIGDGEEDMLVFDPSETTILELGSGCGLLGIVMVERCQDLLLTDQEPYYRHLSRTCAQTWIKNTLIRITKAPTRLKSTTPGGASPQGVTIVVRAQITRSGHGRIQVQALAWGQELEQDLRRNCNRWLINMCSVVSPPGD